jgi:hypothetical protein
MPGNNVELRIRTIVGNILRIESAEIRLDSRLRAGLDATEDDVALIADTVAAEFDLRFHPSRYRSWRVVCDIVISVERKLAGRAKPPSAPAAQRRVA